MLTDRIGNFFFFFFLLTAIYSGTLNHLLTPENFFFCEKFCYDLEPSSDAQHKEKWQMAFLRNGQLYLSVRQSLDQLNYIHTQAFVFASQQIMVIDFFFSFVIIT